MLHQLLMGLLELAGIIILCGVIVFAVTIIGMFIKYVSIACRNESNNKHDGDES